MKKYFCLSIALLLAALNFNLILKPLELVTGGTQGLALILHALTDFNPSIIILVINLFTLFLSYFMLSKETTRGTVVAAIEYPLFVKLTSSFPDFSIIHQQEMIFVVLAGIVCGLTGGYVYKLGFSSGGVHTINLLVNKYLNIKVALSNFLINAMIIIGGCFIFGMKKALYSIIVITVSSFLINQLLGRNKEKSNKLG